MGGTAITISDDEEYEDVASPTMTVEPPSTPIGVTFDSATGKGKRFKWADYEEEEEEDLYVRDVLGGSVVEPPTTVVEPPTTVVEPPTTVVVATQTDPMEFPFVVYPRGTKWLLK